MNGGMEQILARSTLALKWANAMRIGFSSSLMDFGDTCGYTQKRKKKNPSPHARCPQATT